MVRLSLSIPTAVLRLPRDPRGISSIGVLGNRIVILNSAKAAIDVRQKLKSAVNSDRPHLTMTGDLVDWGDSFVLMQYGERFQQSRKIFHEIFGSPSSLNVFHPIQPALCAECVEWTGRARGLCAQVSFEIGHHASLRRED